MIKTNYWKYSLITLVILMGCGLLYEFMPFLGGFLGAFTIYVLVRNQMHTLTEKRGWNKNLAALLILLAVVLLFMIPALMGVLLLVKVAENLIQNIADIETTVGTFVTFLQKELDINLMSREVLVQMSGYLTEIGRVVVGEISTFVVSAFVLLFVLFFMLISSRPMEKYIFEILPFSEKNKRDISFRVKKLILSNAIGIPLLGIIQGLVATLGFIIFGVPMPWLFGLLTCFATIIPLLGTGLVWLPLVIYLAVTKDWGNAIGLAAYSLIIITNIDNVFRFLLQKRLADIHPLITVFGVIIGLSVFGFWGIIFGPVVLSIFFMLVDIFKKEYLDTTDTPSDITIDDVAESD